MTHIMIEPVPATNQAGEVERLRGALIEAQRYLQNKSPDGYYSGEADVLDIVNAALATQPATSQEGEEAPRVAAFHAIYGPNGDLFENPEGYAFASDVADAVLAATPTPPTLSEDLRALEPFVAHWQPWMDERDDSGAYFWPDAYEMSCFARVTYGDLRRARTALARAQVQAS